MAAILELLAFIALVVTIIAGLLQIADRLERAKKGRKDSDPDRADDR